ncbi:MAG TPA: DUF4129 domain-containing protein, partial [Rhodoglobus sp.]|nr:DUF4129 domain-containing protein [Rhodoglobus sp.]
IGGWVALAVILALLAAPAAIRAVRRLRRYAAVRAGSGATAWAELQDTMLDLGRAVEPATTPRQFAQTLLDAGAPEDVTARLLAAVEHEAYAPTPQPPTTRDLRRARWALTEHAAFGTILLSIVWPRSLFAGWLPQHRIALAD